MSESKHKSTMVDPPNELKVVPVEHDGPLGRLIVALGSTVCKLETMAGDLRRWRAELIELNRGQS